ncbi:MAG: N-formylglutamate amidohydrolase, partial [Planctomycetota bacterium]
MTLPLVISVPHAGLAVPEELVERNLLTPAQIAHDGDEGAATIYDFPGEVLAYHRADIARAFVDLNRAEDDFRKDGVIKTHTCWDEPIYDKPLEPALVTRLIERYHRPYHERLDKVPQAALLGVDCHTMAAAGPPVGPDPGKPRPRVCLSNAEGTCSSALLESLADAFRSFFDEVRLNDPFRGGYIIRRHAGPLPWVQLELSRAPFMSDHEKREATL